MEKPQMLELLRKERPTEVIHEVLSIELNEFGFYDVKVNMEGQFLGTSVKHVYQVLPYPLSAYERLTEKQQADWRFKTL